MPSLRRLLRALLLITVGFVFPCSAEEPRISPEAFVDVQPGALPIILSAPHGGTLKEPTFPRRLYGKVIQDAKTSELALAISKALQKQYGASPHLVRCLLHRSKVDCNRDMEEAAQGNAHAQSVWKHYHQACTNARAAVTTSHGRGLLLDLHGHRHEQARVEIGCLIEGTTLNQTDMDLDGDVAVIASSSIADLIRQSDLSPSEILRGSFSLGALLEQRGIPSIPSPIHPDPQGGPYFTGGYITSRHGSRDGGTVSAFQLECPWEGIRDTESNRQRFAVALAESLGHYFQKHFGITLGSGSKDTP